MLVLAAVAAGSASAAELTIYPGVGVDKVNLGMTRAQVLRVLGKDSAATAGRRTSRGTTAAGR